MRLQIIVSVTSLLSVLAVSVASADVWDEAEKQIVRLDPLSFSQLPKNIVEELKNRRCKIPQTFGHNEPHNVIKGSFAEKGQEDWAVLCSKNGVSTIQIFWGGSARCPSEIQKSEDRGWLQVVVPGKIGYSRAINSISKKPILAYHEAYGGVAPPSISHDGINDVFLEKASVVHYCNQGKWIELTGAD